MFVFVSTNQIVELMVYWGSTMNTEYTLICSEYTWNTNIIRDDNNC